MDARLLSILFAGVLVIAGCGGGEQGGVAQTGVDEAYEKLIKERKVMDSPAERMAATKAFLAEFPESEHTASSIDAVFYYAERLDDVPATVVYVEGIRAAITDPGIATKVDQALIGVYAGAGMMARATALAEKLSAISALDFDKHWLIIEAAVDAGEWDLVRDYCAKAAGMATAEAYRAENPDRDIPTRELAFEVNKRTGMLLVKDAWARANQGRVDEAIADFARADSLIPRYYFDIPEYDLNVYWARTLVAKGEFQPAIERLALDGLIMRNGDALAVLEEAYVGIHGGDMGFDAFAEDLRRAVAPTIDDFEMPDYEGKRHRFFDLRNEVTLLTFWFPT